MRQVHLRTRRPNDYRRRDPQVPLRTERLLVGHLVYNYFLSDEREQLLPSTACTTTVAPCTTTRVPLLPLLRLLPLRSRTAPKRTLQRYNETTPWMTRGMLVVLYEMFPVCASCRFVRLSCSSVASSPTRGNPVTGSPHLSSCSTRSPSSFAPVSQRVTRTEMLRCIIFGSLPWHPFLPPR